MGEWFIVSDFWDSYCINRVCELAFSWCFPPYTFLAKCRKLKIMDMFNLYEVITEGKTEKWFLLTCSSILTKNSQTLSDWCFKVWNWKLYNMDSIWKAIFPLHKNYAIMWEFVPTWGRGLLNSQNACFNIALKTLLNHLKMTHTL